MRETLDAAAFKGLLVEQPEMLPAPLNASSLDRV
jgi:hypothetical protein